MFEAMLGGSPGAPGRIGRAAPDGERALLERLAALLPRARPGEVYFGDDAAVLGGDRGPLLLTTDSSVSGVHADLALVAPDDLGWKAMAAAISDIAAMGGRPIGAVVSVCAPVDCDVDLVMRGIVAAAGAHGCPVVGGDLANAPAAVVTVTVLGSGDGAPPVLRSGAHPGDTVFVTGETGAAAAGLALLRTERAARTAGRETVRGRDNAARGGRLAAAVLAHRRPTARLPEGRTARAAGATAMIDVSDGLARDVDNLATASGIGVSLERVPVAAGAELADALGGGEDYELVFTAPDAEGVARAFALAGLRTPLAIGRCTSDAAERSLDGGPLPLLGYAHDFRR